MKKVAVLLSGSGVYDGAEIHESVLTLLALDQNQIAYQCIAPNIAQHHVVDHTTGNEMDETRNVLVEAARIARGDIKSTNEIKTSDYSALIMPGGFGAAKNLSKWAFNGPDGEIEESTKQLILGAVTANLPIVAMCMSPVVIAKALQGSKYEAKLTVGSTAAKSPYQIEAISQGMQKIGATAEMKTVNEVLVDEHLKIITTPCYMMEASITQINEGIQKAVQELIKLI